MFFLKALPTRAMIERYVDRDAGDDPAQVEDALQMMRSASLLLRKIERHFASHGLSQLKFLVLIVIDREARETGLRHGEIHDRIDVSKPVLSRSLRALVERGFLSETSDPSDQRSLLLTITPKGRDCLAALLPEYFSIIHAHTRDDFPIGTISSTAS